VGYTMTVRKKLAIAAATLLVVLILFAAFYELTLPDQDTLYQVSAFNVFSEGNFDGNVTYAELAKHGNFGIGTLNQLNGEMIAFDGKFYQIPTNDSPREIGSEEKTPYATVTFFSSDYTFPVANVTSYLQLTENINSTLLNFNVIYAIKVHGFFDFAQTRSVPIQTKPYPNLSEAVKNQTIFDLNEVEGTMAGFFFPTSMNGIDYVGYHLHFLTDDHTAGGHLLECVIKNATVEIDQTNDYHLLLP
jgi:acetolactate decarboxylase